MDISNKDHAATEKENADAQRPFLQKDYELKINYLAAQYTRMWTRFNFFLVLESGLSAALWLWFKDKGAFIGQANPLAWLGLVTSFCWYVMGAEDRYLVVVYRSHVEDAGKKVKQDLELQDYVYVSDPTRPLIEQKIYQWRFEPLSTTKLAAWFPILVTLYWIMMIVMTSK
ncbi:MAG TPA: hypothetical protein VK249_06670 [Anaerolineales bacterium]|nr:hypothetical protein [Anaerolineales bacterium]